MFDSKCGNTWKRLKPAVLGSSLINMVYFGSRQPYVQDSVKYGIGSNGTVSFESIEALTIRNLRRSSS